MCPSSTRHYQPIRIPTWLPLLLPWSSGITFQCSRSINRQIVGIPHYLDRSENYGSHRSIITSERTPLHTT
ncbi:hypothetical protein BJY01DRAFT_197118 [Aspergillus pseudoustus]|uniref:Secreted protein n=1 Tax=Aspergillus pseudoustus TaxID=1810923 RepID=A0ABR4JTE2_9EURO